MTGRRTRSFFNHKSEYLGFDVGERVSILSEETTIAERYGQ